MIKVMNLVSLLILPAVISLRHHTGDRLGIAAVSLVILIGALAFSKRATEDMGADAPTANPAAEVGAIAAAAD
jgi:K(+)-stimulated pyrophosphate-energized sodium pump